MAKRDFFLILQIAGFDYDFEDMLSDSFFQRGNFFRDFCKFSVFDITEIYYSVNFGGTVL